jgi:transcriptional regulator of heat shock response
MDGIANAVIAEAASRLNELIEGIKVVLNENSHLADGEDCTLIKLKKLIDYEPHN